MFLSDEKAREPSPAQREKEEDAVLWRSSGMSYRQIARRQSVHLQTAYNRVQRGLRRERTEFAESEADHRDFDLIKLRRLERVMMKKALEGDTSAAWFVMQAMHTRQKLLRIETPTTSAEEYKQAIAMLGPDDPFLHMPDEELEEEGDGEMEEWGDGEMTNDESNPKSETRNSDPYKARDGIADHPGANTPGLFARERDDSEPDVVYRPWTEDASPKPKSAEELRAGLTELHDLMQAAIDSDEKGERSARSQRAGRTPRPRAGHRLKPGGRTPQTPTATLQSRSSSLRDVARMAKIDILGSSSCHDPIPGRPLWTPAKQRRRTP